MVEVKGTKKSAAERHATQLEKWASAYLEAHDEQAKPILVVNAFRDRPPSGRFEPAFPPQMLSSCEARQHCLVTSSQLLGAVLAVESGQADGIALLESMFSTAGCWDQYQDVSSFLAASHERENATAGAAAVSTGFAATSMDVAAARGHVVATKRLSEPKITDHVDSRSERKNRPFAAPSHDMVLHHDVRE